MNAFERRNLVSCTDGSLTGNLDLRRRRSKLIDANTFESGNVEGQRGTKEFEYQPERRHAMKKALLLGVVMMLLIPSAGYAWSWRKYYYPPYFSPYAYAAPYPYYAYAPYPYYRPYPYYGYGHFYRPYPYYYGYYPPYPYGRPYW
jgi:hypothetical protein